MQVFGCLAFLLIFCVDGSLRVQAPSLSDTVTLARPNPSGLGASPRAGADAQYDFPRVQAPSSQVIEALARRSRKHSGASPRATGTGSRACKDVAAKALSGRKARVPVPEENRRERDSPVRATRWAMYHCRGRRAVQFLTGTGTLVRSHRSAGAAES